MSTRDNDNEHKALHSIDRKTIIYSNLSQPKSVPLGEQTKAVRRQHLMALLMNLGILTGGISLALPAVTLDQLTDSEETVHLSQSQASWYASCSSLTCPLGSILSALILDLLGRKKSVIISNILGIISWALMAFPIEAFGSDGVFMQLMASRLLSGVVKGLGVSAAGTFGAEIGLPKLRARLIMIVTMAVAFGVLFIYILGYFIRNDWRMLGKILLGYQVLCVISLTPVIESPIWLLSKGYNEKAKTALAYFRGLEPGETQKEVEVEFELLSNSLQPKNEENKLSFWNALKRPVVYKPFLLSFCFYILQQFAGTFVVIVYAVQILTKFGLHIDPFLCAVYLGIARFLVASFIMTWELEKWTRHQVLNFSALSMSCSLFVLAVSSWFPWLEIPYLPAMTIIAFVITSAGVWAVPFLISSETFPQNLRGTCCGITDAFAYFMSFVAIKAFPSMVDGMGIGNVFALFGVFALLNALFMSLYVPETKGKTLLEIEEHFRGAKKYQHKNHKNKEKEMKELFMKTQP